MLTPVLSSMLRQDDLEAAVKTALLEGRDVENTHFFESELPELAGETVEFSG